MSRDDPDRDASADADAVTDEFPVVRPGRGADGTVPWLLLGGLLGLALLLALAGGVPVPWSRGDTPPPATASTPAAAELAVAATGADGLYFEVRRRNATGAVLFAGTIERGVTRRFPIPAGDALWLTLAWAPNARVSVDGVVQPADDGTATLLVTADGATAVTGRPGNTTTSR